MKKDKSNFIYNTLLNRDLCILIVLSMSAFLLRFAFMMFSDNFRGAQPMLNIITALHIYNFPGLWQNIYYQQLPVHLYTLFCSIAMGSEQIMSARLFSVICGSASVVPVYFLFKETFNEKTAIISTAVFCFYPNHLLTSVITMPDALALFFALGAIYYLQKSKVILSAFCFSLACGTAYVYWLMIPLVWALIFIPTKKMDERKRIIKSSIFIIITCLFPVIWILLVNKEYKTHNLFYRNLFEKEFFLQYLFVFMQTVQDTVKKLILQITPLLSLISLIGIYQSLRKKQAQMLTFLSGAMILFISAAVFRREIPIIEQGLLVISVLMIPFIVTGLETALNFFGLKKGIYIMLIVGLLCSYLLLLDFKSFPRIPQNVKNLSMWIEDNISRTDNIYINCDKQGYFSSIIMLSKFPQSKFYCLDNDAMEGFLEGKKGENNYFICSEILNFKGISEFEEIVSFDNYKVLTSLKGK